MHFYEFGIVCVMIVLSVFPAFLLVNYLMSMSTSYIKDKPYETTGLAKKLVDKTILTDSPIDGLFIMLIWLCCLIVAMIWPIALIAITGYVVLYSMRFSYRVKTKLGKLFGFAHKHPASVKQEDVDVELKGE